jgi:hypothetical protein
MITSPHRVIAVALLVASFTAAATETSPRPYVVLDPTLSQLRADFNVNAGKVRLLHIVGPTCGICLRGLSDLQEALYSKKGDDPRIVTFVVHVPTLGAHEANVAPASGLISNSFTTNYWEETGIIGRLMQRAMGFDQYTWDFWTIYDPQVVWSDAHQIPAPKFWQHQLHGLPPERKLDPDAFAAKVDELLAQLPRSAAANPAAAKAGASGIAAQRP